MQTPSEGGKHEHLVNGVGRWLFRVHVFGGGGFKQHAHGVAHSAKPLGHGRSHDGAQLHAAVQTPDGHGLPSGVSNWWGWGIRAVLSAVTGRDLMPTDEQENKLLRAVVSNGCVDGVTGEAVLTVDHLSQEENLRVLRELRVALQMPDYAHMEPAQARRLFRDNSIVRPTAGMCAGRAQCNLIVLPSDLAADFREFAKRNPFSCPVLEESEKGSRLLKKIASDVDLARDFPKYRVWKDGHLVEQPLDVESYWNDDLVAFLIGCSFSFEDLRAMQVRYL